MSGLIDYKCPNCSGTIEFNPSSQEMVCPYCDTTIDVESLMDLDSKLSEENNENLNWDNTNEEYFSEEETQGMNVYICQSCSGEVVADETLGSSKCPFCDNNIVMHSKFSGDLKPDAVIPFLFDKKQAKETLKKHVDKRFVPQIFKDENHIDEIKGVYVPVWLFDSHVDAEFIFKGDIVRTYSDSEYNYTETSVYRLDRSGNLDFANIPVDGSTKMDDDLMESIEPFDVVDMKPFQTAYLAGYMANRYDVDKDECVVRANERIKNSTEELFMDSTREFTNVRTERRTVNLSDNRCRYVMYPVWLLNTSWGDKKFVFAMNGQTGKMVGNLPMDKGKAAMFVLATSVITSAIIYALAWFLR